ncbi:MAG: DUF4383 domain-containing protein, partial [Alphaproteobacteria bacterium]
MFTKKFARTFGLLMLGTGLFALVPGLSLYDQPLPNLNIESSYGSFLGIFPMNMVNKLVLMLMGIIGVSCGNAKTYVNREHDSKLAILWSRILLFIMGPLAILGMFEQTNTLGGY